MEEYRGESPVGGYSIRCLAKKTSTDRSSFKAIRSLKYEEVSSSTNHKREGLTLIANNEKRSLTVSGS